IDGAIERLDRLLKREFSAEWLALKVRLLAKQNEWQVLVDTYEMIKSGESGGSQEFAEDIKLLYAVALFNTTRFADAQIVLSELARNPKYTEQAQQWLSYVRAQLKPN
ncbi:MAG: hypothetical protein MI864_20225, partial [Pseudomonadales bacterium]|nr:hypothetical protein [Pseudomonadales bacterium]